MSAVIRTRRRCRAWIRSWRAWGSRACPTSNGPCWSARRCRRARSGRGAGLETRTLWGELAWQLLGADGYKLVEASDRNGVSPGSDLLHELLAAAAPCLILIDEWIAFVRQLYSASGLPAGSFDSNITFAQALTEAVKATPGALLVATLPASQIEIGGEGGEVALDRLKNTFGRIESSWRPASADEGFEIVRRRLFQPMVEREAFAARDNVIKAFATMYRDNGASFPSECSEGDYRRRMEAAYPIHPELFDRLNNDWGSLDRFQRTRGVLRLMANVIHCLWERGDKSLMILPSSIPLDDALVQSRVTRLLEQKWDAIISADIDGETSKPLAIDRENPQPGALLGDAPGGAHDLHGLGADLRRAQSRDRRSPHPARLRAAGRDAGVVRRRAAPARGRCDLPLRRQRPLLVLGPAQRDAHGR